MDSYMDALYRIKSWDLVPLPPNANVVGNKWVYKIKQKANGDIDRFKACLVAKGYSQESGLDYTKTFSPVVKPIIVCVLLSMPVCYNLKIY